MSILNDAYDIRIGSSPVDFVYLGDQYIWPPIGSGFWTFDAQPSTLSGMKLGLSGNNNSIIFWGDGEYNRAKNGQSRSHTYL
jgi:hypothetical protein